LSDRTVSEGGHRASYGEKGGWDSGVIHRTPTEATTDGVVPIIHLTANRLFISPVYRSMRVFGFLSALLLPLAAAATSGEETGERKLSTYGTPYIGGCG
jgi:hypothetical protein